MDRLSIAGALGTLTDSGESYKRLLEKADFDVGMYKPGEIDDQTPHIRDEIYIVASGTGTFFCAGERQEFGPGDVFYVAAGVEHRFETFSNDFATWVVFLGART
nr:MAG: cupin domain-containing protein [Hyphomicrobiales bacterium]